MDKNDDRILRATGLLIIEVINSNPDGDPDREGDPRQRADGRGVISPVSFKRKLRNLLEDGESVVWEELPKELIDDKGHFQIFESRKVNRKDVKKLLNDDDSKGFKDAYWDGRIFGNTVLEEAMNKATIKTGVVQFGMGVSISKIEIERWTQTKMVPVEDDKQQGMAPLGYRIVKHGVYCMPFFVNPNMAHKTGCTKKDIDLLKALIPYAYPLNPSTVRPYVGIRHAWYCEHKNQLGSCSDFDIIDSLTPKKESDKDEPSTSWSDYDVPTSLPSELTSKLYSPCIDLVMF